MTILNESNFETEVMGSEEPVFVDFFATWCGPCKMMSPIVDELEGDFTGKVKFGKCDIDENMEIAQKYGVMSIPTFIVFKGGEAVAQRVGGAGKGDLKSFIEGAL